jgi:hypothetical protein
MKKVFAALGMLTFMVLPVQSFAWEYDGLGSLNPFTGFRNCNPCRCKCEKVRKPKLTKCEKLHGYKIIKDEAPTGCAAPIIYETIVVPKNLCPKCMKAF